MFSTNTNDSMMNCSKILRWSVRAAAAVAAAVAVSCTTADDSLGYGFVPDDQKMKIRRAVLDRITAPDSRIITTRLYKTDSIISSNITYGYMGAQNDADFGKRRAGFFSQYVAMGTSHEEGFGYRPIFDSIQLLINVADYKGDTLVPQTFLVYEVTDDFIKVNTNADGKADTVFYATFDPADFRGKRYISAEPAFTFVFPDGVSTGPATKSVTMTPTQTGMSLIKRLMLMEGKYQNNNMAVYKDDKLWVDYFKGLYIVPAGDADGEGAMYSLQLDDSGMAIYGRNRRKDDPELIQDTTQAMYYFYYSKADAGNVSVNSVVRDYTGTQLSEQNMQEPADSRTDTRPASELCYVEGMGGPVTEITFEKEFLKRLDALRTVHDAETGGTVEHSSIAFNQARLLIYVRGAQYDWEAMTPDIITPELDNSMSRLGLYLNYKRLQGVVDYNYLYEKQYSMELDYGGYLTRSWGCYSLDITGYIQGLWNGYQALEDKNDLSTLTSRTVYLGPEAYGLFDLGHSVVQGMEGDTDSDGISNDAPMKIELTYTLIR